MLLRFDGYELDLRTWALRRDGQDVSVQPKALELLFHLAKNRERLVTKEELMDLLWPGIVVSDTALSQAVKKARSAVGDVGGSQRIIRTIRGVGFRFVADTSASEPEPETGDRAHAAAKAAPPPAKTRDRPLIGRQRDLAAAEAALDGVLEGAGRIVLIQGEAGIGKTRLALAIADAARAREATVAEGWCHREFRVACAPWSQILAEIAGSRSPAQLSSLLGSSAPFVAQLLPDLIDRLPDLEAPPPLKPEEARFRLFGAVGSLFTGLARETPLVLVLEDLHWADGESLKLLEFLLHRLRTSAILVVGTYRAEAGDSGSMLARTLAEIDRHDLATHIRLDNLSREEVSGFVRGQKDIESSPELLDALYERTQGNPFFLAQVLDLLRTERRVGSVDDAASPAQDWLRVIPPAVHQVLAQRLAAVTERTRWFLTVAAVCGAEFDAFLVERVCRTNRSELLDGLEEGERNGLIHEVTGSLGRFRFIHTLAREALEDTISSLRRAELHAEIGACAEALYAENLDNRLGELAYHFYEGARAKRADKAVEYARLAGREAMRRGAYEEATLQFERGIQAVDLLPSTEPVPRYELMMSLARARHGLGNHVRARDAFGEAARYALASGAAAAYAEAALGFAALPDNTGEIDATCVEILRRAAEMIGEDGDPSLHARLSTRLAVFQMADPGVQEESKSLLVSAAEIARAAGSTKARLETLLAQVRVMRVSGEPNPAERLALSREALALANAAGAEVHAMIAQGQEIAPLLELGERESADQTIEEFRRQAEALRIPAWLWLVPQHRAMQMMIDGRYDRVEETSAESLPVAAQIPGSIGPFAHAVILGGLRREQGRLDELVGYANEAAARFPNLPLVSALLALSMAESGRDEEALRLLEEAPVGDWVGKDGWRAALSVLADVCAHLGNVEKSHTLYELLAPTADHNLVVGEGNLFLGPAARSLGQLAALLGRWADAEAHFEKALLRCRQVQSPPWEARTRLSYAQALLSRGRSASSARARVHLTTANEIATRLRMTAVRRDVDRIRAG